MHVIASQSPMTFPIGEYLINKMRHYYHFEKNTPVPNRARLQLPTSPGFGIEWDSSRIDSQRTLRWD
jgi:hypothetical protein